MNTPQRYCCTLEQSKRLRELGVDAPAIWNYIRYDDNDFVLAPTGWYDPNDMVPEYRFWEFVGTCHEEYPAYSVGELGKAAGWMMDEGFEGSDEFMDNWPAKLSTTFNPDFLASYIIHGIECGKFTPSQVNNQLK